MWEKFCHILEGLCAHLCTRPICDSRFMTLQTMYTETNHADCTCMNTYAYIHTHCRTSVRAAVRIHLGMYPALSSRDTMEACFCRVRLYHVWQETLKIFISITTIVYTGWLLATKIPDTVSAFSQDQIHIFFFIKHETTMVVRRPTEAVLMCRCCSAGFVETVFRCILWFNYFGFIITDTSTFSLRS